MASLYLNLVYSHAATPFTIAPKLQSNYGGSEMFNSYSSKPTSIEEKIIPPLDNAPNDKIAKENAAGVLPDNMCVYDTLDDTDCAFHAVLGSWNQSTANFVHPNISRGRIRVANAIRNCRSIDQLMYETVTKCLKLSIAVREKEIFAGSKRIARFKQQYNDQMTDKVSFESWMADQEILDEYAELMVNPANDSGTIAYSLIPQELEIIALCFKITIELFVNNGQQIVLDTIYNPGYNAVRVYFNGDAIYQKIDRVGKHVIRPAVSSGEAHDTSAVRPKYLKDKAGDLQALFNAYLEIETLFIDANEAYSPSMTKIQQLLIKLSELFASLNWNNDSEYYIRTLYGKINYKNGSKNSDHIDFERFSFPHKIADKGPVHEMSKIISADYKEKSSDFRILQQNLILILRRELINEQNPELNRQCGGIVEHLLKIESTAKARFVNLKHLPRLFDFYYDKIFISKICQINFESAFAEINHLTDQVEYNYVFARMISIIGEAARNLSDGIKEKLKFLYLHDLIKLRNKFNHGAALIKTPGSDIQKLILEINTQHFPALKNRLIFVLNYYEKSIYNDAFDSPTENLFAVFLSKFKNQPKQKFSDITEDLEVKAKGIINNLLEEMQLLAKLSQGKKVATARNFAQEFCISCIGQLIRDLRKSKCLLIEQIDATNITVRGSFDANVSARNSNIAHDPFGNHKKLLVSLSNEHIFTLSNDVSALKTIIETNDPKDLPLAAIQTLVKTYYDIGCSYLRLGVLDRAEQYLRLATDHTQAQYYAFANMLKMGWENVEFNDIKMQREGAVYTAQIPGFIFCGIDDFDWVQHRVTCLHRLTLCLLYQKRLDEGCILIKEALDIYTSYIYIDPLILTNLLYTYITIQICLGVTPLDSLGVELEGSELNALEYISKYNFNAYAQAIICYAYTIGIKGCKTNIVQATQLLSKIDISLITEAQILMSLRSAQAELYGLYAVVLQKQINFNLNNSNNLVSLLKRAVNRSIQEYEMCFNIHSLNSARFKTELGDSHRIQAYLPAMESYAKVIANKAAWFSDEDPEDSYNLINKSLNIQSKYKFETIISYQTLGAICEIMYAKTGDNKYMLEALAAYDRNTDESLSIPTRAKANAGKAVALMGLNNFVSALESMVEAKLLYVLIPQADKNQHDVEEELYLNSRIKLYSTPHKLELISLIQDRVKIADEQALTKEIKKSVDIYRGCIEVLRLLKPEFAPILLKSITNKLDGYENGNADSKQVTEITPLFTKMKIQQNEREFCGVRPGFLL